MALSSVRINTMQTEGTALYTGGTTLDLYSKSLHHIDETTKN